MLDFIALSKQCAPHVAPSTMQAIVQVESGFNPYSIGVVGGRLHRQPRNLAEALVTAKSLEAQNWNFSVGISQVNRQNLHAYQMTYRDAFDPCMNLKAGSKILQACFLRAKKRFSNEQSALQASFSCYYSGNFKRGFMKDTDGKSYVSKVLASSLQPIRVIEDKKPIYGKPNKIFVHPKDSAEVSKAVAPAGNTILVEEKNHRFEEEVIVF